MDKGKASVSMRLNKENRENKKPLHERPHDMSDKDIHDLFFGDTVFSNDHTTRE